MNLSYFLVILVLQSICGFQLEKIFQNIGTNKIIVDTKFFKSSYDFIVIGAGSGGSVVANRLSEIEKWKVLLLEAGGDEDFLTDIPAYGFVTGYVTHNWGYKLEKQEGNCLGMEGGQCLCPKGKSLGGTSVINLMMYYRGSKQDFDSWEENGNYNWNYKNVLNYFKKSEKALADDIDAEYHGYNGSLNVEHARYQTPLLKAFLESSKYIGYSPTDPNGKNPFGFSWAQATIHAGRRVSASKAFLRRIQFRKNLSISKRSYVTKILIDPTTKVAYGVEFYKNFKKYVVKASKEVILSAGSINSPKILMLSGIGPKEHLMEVKVPLIQNLQVGYNLQDHPAFFGLTFLLDKPVSFRYPTAKDLFDYLVNKKGPLTLPGGAEGVAFLKINTSRTSPDMEIVMGAGGINVDYGKIGRKIIGFPEEFYQKVFKQVRKKHGVTFVPVLLKTKSRGRVMLRNGNPFEAPKIYGNYFAEEEDVRNIIKAVKMTIAVGESEPFKAFNSTLHKTPYPGCEHSEWGSDPYWECCARRYTNSLFHQSGTCKMGPASDPTAVVDPELKVYGIKGLRVVDASIMPELIAGHPNAAVYMIGEKAADMVKNTWNNK